MTTSQIQQTMFAQCNAKALQAFCGFKLGIEGSNTIHLKKGMKAMSVTYNEASDDYVVKQTSWNRKFEFKDTVSNSIYCDQLQELIMNFWKIDIPRISFGSRKCVECKKTLTSEDDMGHDCEVFA